MFSLVVTIIALLGVKTLKVSGTEVDLTVKPGDNVTLYCVCNCSLSSGPHIKWYRNCSHHGQPTFEMSFRDSMYKRDQLLPLSYEYTWNDANQSYGLLIKNITESELGVYYCSVAETTVVDETVIQQKVVHSFGNITYKLSFEDVTTPPPSSPPPNPDCHQCWSQLAIWCPVCALLSALISSSCVYCLCRSTTGLVEHGERSRKQDEDRELCYASLDVPTRTHTAKPKEKRTPAQNSDFSTYSEVRTHRI